MLYIFNFLQILKKTTYLFIFVYISNRYLFHFSLEEMIILHMHFQTMHISSSFLLGVFIHSFSTFYRVCALGCIFPRSREYHSELDRWKNIYISSEKFTWLSVFVNLLTKARREKGDDNYWEFWVLFKIKKLLSVKLNS